MLNRVLVLLALSTFGATLYAADEAPFPPSVYKSAAELMATLAKSSATRAAQASAWVRAVWMPIRHSGSERME